MNRSYQTLFALAATTALASCGSSNLNDPRAMGVTSVSSKSVPTAVLQASRSESTTVKPSARALATEWCSADPKPATAKVVFDPTHVDLVLHKTYFWEDADLPKRTWCFVRDNFGRSGQCVGLGSGNCLQGWVDRQVGSFQGQTWLHFINQHSTDVRYVTLWRD